MKFTEFTKRIKTHIGIFIANLLFPNKLFQKLFNRFGGIFNYGIYNRIDIIEGIEFIDYYVTKNGIKHICMEAK